MPLPITPQSRALLATALDRMTSALEMLDEAEAPGEIGATLDLAIVRLGKLLGRPDAATAGPKALFVQLDLGSVLLDDGSGARPGRWEIPPV